MTSQVNFDNWQRTSGATVATVLQVKHKIFRDTWSQAIANGSTWYDTPLQCSITLTSETSKVLVMVSVHLGTSYWEVQGRLVRNNAPIGIGDAAGSRSRCGFAHLKYDNGYDYYDVLPVKYNFLDAGMASPSTYKVQLQGYSTGTIHLNRSHSDQDAVDQMGRSVSTITLMEIAQ